MLTIRFNFFNVCIYLNFLNTVKNCTTVKRRKGGGGKHCTIAFNVRAIQDQLTDGQTELKTSRLKYIKSIHNE